MRKRLGCLLAAMAGVMVPGVASGQAAAPAAPIAIVRDARMAAAVDRAAAALIRDRATAGLVVAVSQGGRPVLVKGYGMADLEQGTPATAQTVFRIGSVTKEFTAAAVLLLAERGKLSVDDRLAKYLPDFPRAREVTLRQLLNHVSGIHNYTSAPDFMTNESVRNESTAGMVAYIARQRPLFDFEPGTAWSYSNSGFLLLGAVIEKVTGQSYAQFVRANIFEPLGLDHTRVDDLAEIVPHRASGYDKAAQTPTGFANAGYIAMGAAASAGAIRSTGEDLLAWHAALLGGKLLKPESLAMMLAPGRLGDGRLASAARVGAKGEPVTSDYGFGITVGRQKGRRTIGHGGAINGFNSSIETYPDDKLTVVMLVNTTGAVPTAAEPILDAVFASPGQSAKGGAVRR